MPPMTPPTTAPVLLAGEEAAGVGSTTAAEPVPAAPVLGKPAAESWLSAEARLVDRIVEPALRTCALMDAATALAVAVFAPPPEMA